MTDSVNIKHIAQKAGVSIKTVSRVINNRPDVSPETRTRVQEIIDSLGYHPNAIAQGLRAHQTFTIAFVILHYQPRALLSENHLAGIVSGIVDSLSEQGYYLLTYPVPDSEDALRGLRALLNSGRVDGVIVQQAYPDDPLIEIIAAANLPTGYIGLDRIPHALSFNVTADFGAGTRLALEHLVAKGHTRIGHLQGDCHFTPFQDRVNAFRGFLKEHDLPVHEEWIIGDGWSRQHGFDAMGALLALPERPTAIVAATDTIAIGAMDQIHQQGLRIPQDFAIVGFDDIPLSADLVVPLTTVRTSFYRFGHLAASNLIGLIKDTDVEPGQFLVPHRLVERAST
jgi:LacI family transcriptional regulator